MLEEEAREREKATRARILAAGREQKIKEEAEKAQLPVGILQAVGGLPPEEKEEEVEIPTVSTPSPPPTPNTSPETSPEPTSFCVAVPAAMLMVSGMVLLSG